MHFQNNHTTLKQNKKLFSLIRRSLRFMEFRNSIRSFEHSKYQTYQEKSINIFESFQFYLRIFANHRWRSLVLTKGCFLCGGKDLTNAVAHLTTLHSIDCWCHPQEIIRHPYYDASFKKNDIALIRLRASIPFGKSIRPACLQLDVMDEDPSTVLYESGWGKYIWENAGLNWFWPPFNIFDKTVCSAT